MGKLHETPVTVCSNCAIEPGFFAPYFVSPSDLNNPETIAQFEQTVTGVSCSLSSGSSLAVSACVLYFLSALMIPCSILPAYANQAAYALQQQEQAQQNGGGFDAEAQA